MSNTVYMNLQLPIPSVSIGPAWATALNTAIESIDEHDHTNAKGKLVPSAGLNINADLDLNAHSLFNALSLKFNSVISALSGATNASSVYVCNGNLYFTNSAGTAIQITNGGSVVATPGSAISFEVFAVAGDLVISPADIFVVVSVDTSVARQVTLPSAGAVVSGRIYIIKDVSGNGYLSPITVTADGTDTVDLAANTIIDSSFGSLMLISDGISNWQLV